MQQFHAQGKLLLTGEYAVLDGALALAIPTQQGQSLSVAENPQAESLDWTSYDHQNKVWLALRWRPMLALPPEIHIGDTALAERLINILKKAIQLRDGDFSVLAGKTVKSQLGFDRQWGLGSSSTLLHCIASWLEVDAFALLEATFGGSGYDLACATAKGPILFQRQNGQAVWEEVNWQPEWLASSYFLYLNKKQNSREGIAQYRQQAVQTTDIATISNYTAQLLEARLLREPASEYIPMAKPKNEQKLRLQKLGSRINKASAPSLVQSMSILAAHEASVARLTKQATIQSTFFPDFPGQIKSLGAWGGDFAWVLSELDEAACRNYFHQKGYDLLLPWSALALEQKTNFSG